MIPYHIVASQTKDGVIGIHNTLFCECSDDLKRFYKITTDTYPETRDTTSKNILIMGYKTWVSIPESVRPFKKRISLVVSRDHVVEARTDGSVVQVSSLQRAFEYCSHNARGRVFVIGGESIFDQCVCP